MKDWEPELYNRFRGYRAEPFHAILERLQIDPDERIVDLGCGSGENSVELARRTPTGCVVGIDSSPAMIARALALKRTLPAELAGRIDFRLCDILAAGLSDLYSLVFSNAALQWIDDQRAAIAACCSMMRPGGKLVVQMPANDQETAQATLVALAAESPWRQMLEGAELRAHKVGPPEYYQKLLAELGCCDINCYYQVFSHPMSGPDEVVEWSRATALRPFLGALPEGQRERFLAQWRSRLQNAYGTNRAFIFSFRRIFLWARRRAEPT